MKKGVIYIISDGTGETAATMIRAAIVQYQDADMRIVRSKNVRTELQADQIIDQAQSENGVVVHTVVSPNLRSHIQEGCVAKSVPCVDLMGPLLVTLDGYLGSGADPKSVGLLRTVDERYFKRIAAIEFTVKHDDGKCLEELHLADIILVGISRTSKTPLSIFLSHKGWKVANIPLVLGAPLPEELSKVDQRRVVGLMIDSDSLSRIRKNRLEKFGQDTGSEYARATYIEREIEFALEVFGKNRRWPVFNVTDRALEETAAEIVRVVSARLGLPDKWSF